MATLNFYNLRKITFRNRFQTIFTALCSNRLIATIVAVSRYRKKRGLAPVIYSENVLKPLNWNYWKYA